MEVEIISNISDLKLVKEYRALVDNLTDLERLFISIIVISSVYVLSRIVDNYRKKKS
ncbi:MAG: hypothetical protein ACPGAO_04545 [Flavobacteriaceae bacterium]